MHIHTLSTVEYPRDRNICQSFFVGDTEIMLRDGSILQNHGVATAVAYIRKRYPVM